MTQAKRYFFNDIVSASIFDIIITSELEKFINDGVFNSEHNLQSVVQFE